QFLPRGPDLTSAADRGASRPPRRHIRRRCVCRVESRAFMLAKQGGGMSPALGQMLFREHAQFAAELYGQLVGEGDLPGGFSGSQRAGLHAARERGGEELRVQCSCRRLLDHSHGEADPLRRKRISPRPLPRRLRPRLHSPPANSSLSTVWIVTTWPPTCV